MAFVHEIQIVSHGYPGAPGFTNLYFASDALGTGADAQFAAVHEMLANLGGIEPTSWNGAVNPVGRLLEETTGLLGSFTTAPAGALSSVSGNTGSGFGAGVAGLVIGWATATVNRSRLVRGRTFVVPLANNMYEADGTLTTLCIGGANTAAESLISSPNGFCIWSRPRGGTGGKIAPVLSHRVNDRAAFLSSRRA